MIGFEQAAQARLRVSFWLTFAYNGVSMRKEIVLAVVLGLALGLFITYGVYTARNSLTQPKVQPSPTPSAANSTDQTVGTLVVHNPADEHIQKETETLVSGNTIPNSIVVVIVQDQEYITTADSAGAFTVRAPLKGGANLIIVHAFDENGKETTVERTVIVVDESLGLAADSVATASASPASSPKTTTSPKPSPKVSPTP